MVMFEDETFEAIMERMLARLPDNISKEEGDVVYDLLAPAALELESAYATLDVIFDLAFADTTYGEYLDRRVAEQGLERKAGTKATGSVVLEGTPELDVPSGTIVSTDSDDPIYFITTEDVILDENGTATIGIEAQEESASANVSEGSITVVNGDLQGSVNVTNPQATTGGTDPESDEELLERYLEHVRKPATSGNTADYIQWAKSVAGISDARCYPLWNGPGTVKVVVMNASKRSPNAETLLAVQQYIESMRPVGADVSVVSVNETPINVNATITLATGGDLAVIKTQLAELLTTYFEDTAADASIVRYTQVANAILDCDGVLDYTDLTVNGGTGNVAIETDAVPIVGAINIY